MTWMMALGMAAAVHAAEPVKVDLFRAGEAGYAIFRIPGVVVTRAGTVLVYCEARKSTKDDYGHIDVMMRRSTDGGATFDAPRQMVDSSAFPSVEGKAGGDVTVNNPLAIADLESGAVHFLYCVNYGRCFYMRSDDDGKSFSKPVEITSAFEELRSKYNWKVIATGPGHGLRLKSGRLLVPVWLANGKSNKAHRPSCVATIYSDDGGKSWHAGEIVVTHSDLTPNPSETLAVERADGSVMLNIRNESKKHLRLIETSKDGISGWSAPALDMALVDTICMASLIRTSPGHLVFANPVGDGKGLGGRKNLTVRVSNDDGQTWSSGKLLQEGIAAYSDLAVLPNGQILCFYECGGVKDQQYHTASLRLARFDPQWITDNK